MTRVVPRIRHLLILAAWCYVFFFFGNSVINLTNPDEVFYAQTTKEMMQHHSWFTPYLFGTPQFEKPALTYWLTGISYKVFGVSNYSARLFPALFASLGIFAVYLLGLLGFNDRRTAFLSSLVLASSLLYIGMARTLFTDMFFAIFITLSLLSFYAAYVKTKYAGAGILLFFIFAGLAVLTKGPLGAALPFFTVAIFLAANGKLKFAADRRFIWGAALFLAIAAPWYIVMIKKYGHAFTHEFFYNDHIRRWFEAEHRSNDKWYFYPFTMIVCMFPWSIFVFSSLVRLFRELRSKVRIFHSFLACWIAVVFLAFQFAHSKLITYIFPLFPALALITGDFIYEALVSKKQRVMFRVSLVSLGVFACVPPALWVVKLSKLAWAIAPARMLGTAIAAFCLVLAVVILRRKLLQSVYVLACANLFILATLLFIGNEINPYLASYEIGTFLSSYDIRAPIVCSKAFVRGVRYYADKEVAVFERGKNFFSPHPIPFLGSDDAMRDFVRRQPVTFCVFAKKTAHEIAGIVGAEFKVTTLLVAGDQYVLKIERT
jgi:4-amino-4-deoxy-L-arabinose transferase-like glycosyltransferase